MKFEFLITSKKILSSQFAVSIMSRLQTVLPWNCS